ncbi:regulator protein [Actinokineospora bangkokensis]|uniref:Regulator protein n=1 Tax=Actinokineospora bangkokensis TaxID=1193682 RepID=A0A1Q9LJ50_9PSEU|nr:regulator protein [Actinokineospora bangkokensis]
MLGPVEVHRGGGEIPVDGAKPKTVLAALLLAGERTVPVHQLTDHLWGESPPATHRAQVHTYVSRLRRAFGARVERSAPGYRLMLDGARLDLAEFDALAAAGRAAADAGRADEASTLLGRALAQWRGPALSGVTDHLAAVAGPRLEETRLAVLEQRIALDLDLGRHALALPELTALVRAHPLREGFRAQLMTTHYRCDRQADALAAYHEGRQLLVEELGVEPGAELRRVHEAILAADPALRTGSRTIHPTPV